MLLGSSQMGLRYSNTLGSVYSVRPQGLGLIKGARNCGYPTVVPYSSTERGSCSLSNFQIRGKGNPGERIVVQALRGVAVRKKFLLVGGVGGGGRKLTGVVGVASDSLLFLSDESEAHRLDLTDLSTSKTSLPKLTEGDGDTDESVAVTNSNNESSSPLARAVPWMPAEEAGTLVSEVTLNGDDLSVYEYPEEEEAQPDDAHPFNTFADSVLNNISGDGRKFSLTDVGGLWKTGQEAGEAKVPDISMSGFDVKDGVSPLAQWTSTELTMQHSQLARIATDVQYLQYAFAFFGGVRVVEALLSVFSTSPPDFGKVKELLNALDPLTISWLAYNLRKPIEGIVEVDPLDLEMVLTLKSSLWEELHKFYERQWKVMATIAMARTLGIVASHVPTAEVITSKVKFFWDALMALPVF